MHKRKYTFSPQKGNLVEWRRSTAAVPRAVESSKPRSNGNSSPTRLSLLPSQPQQAIAYFLDSHKVHTAKELAALVECYPIEYLCVELRLPKAEELESVKVLSTQPQLLKEVVVPQSDYTEFAPLVKYLLKLENLECLSLQLHNITTDTADDLLRDCCNSTNKRHFLDLDLSRLNPDKASGLMEQFIQKDKNLFYFDLRNIGGWEDRHNRYLRSLTSRPLQLITLRFFGAEFGKCGTKLLADALARNCSLQSLTFGDGPIGDEDVALFADALAVNTNLKRLRSCNLGMTPEGAAKLAEALLQNKTLAYLVLIDEDVGKKGAEAFAKLIENNSSLRTLGLNYCNLGREGCHLITNAMEKNKSIEHLQILHNNVGLLDARRLIKMPRKAWWHVEVDDLRFKMPGTPRPTILLQNRTDFRTNFREFQSCMNV